MLTYSGDCHERVDNRIISLWVCDCGNLTKKPRCRVITGRIKSCGCTTKQLRRDSAVKHGMKYTKEYNTWASIKARCHNKNNKNYARYGANGINVCEEWQKNFQAFLDHLGLSPSKRHQIDRIDTRGNYEPGNVRWATPSEQCRNTVSSYVWFIKGMKFQTAAEAGEHFMVTEQTIHKWVKGYFDNRRGTFTPSKKGCFAKLRYERKNND